MAEGRLITKDISKSRKFPKLSKEAQVLFCMMIAHLSPYGKMSGNVYTIKGEVCPLIDYLNVENLPRYLKEISKKTNVKWFKAADGHRYIHSTKTMEHQKINFSRVGRDKLPSYPTVTHEQVRSNSTVDQQEEQSNCASKAKAKAKPNPKPKAKSKGAPGATDDHSEEGEGMPDYLKIIKKRQEQIDAKRARLKQSEQPGMQKVMS